MYVLEPHKKTMCIHIIVSMAMGQSLHVVYLWLICTPTTSCNGVIIITLLKLHYYLTLILSLSLFSSKQELHGKPLSVCAYM